MWIRIKNYYEIIFMYYVVQATINRTSFQQETIKIHKDFIF